MFPVEDCFEKCVTTVHSHTSNYRFIFVNDDSDEILTRRITQIARRFPESVVLKTHKQHWFTRAVNLGLRLVKTPYAVVLNCDVVVDAGWLDELYAVKDEVEANVGKVGLVGSQLSGEEPRRYEVTVKGQGAQDYVTGHCWLMNMQAMWEASCAHGTPGWVLDETRADCIHIRSDVALSWELNHLGWQTVRSFKSWVGHIGGRSWGHIIGSIPHSLEQVNYKY